MRRRPASVPRAPRVAAVDDLPLTRADRVALKSLQPDELRGLRMLWMGLHRRHLERVAKIAKIVIVASRVVAAAVAS